MSRAELEERAEHPCKEIKWMYLGTVRRQVQLKEEGIVEIEIIRIKRQSET